MLRWDASVLRRHAFPFSQIRGFPALSLPHRTALVIVSCSQHAYLQHAINFIDYAAMLFTSKTLWPHSPLEGGGVFSNPTTAGVEPQKLVGCSLTRSATNLLGHHATKRLPAHWLSDRMFCYIDTHATTSHNTFPYGLIEL